MNTQIKESGGQSGPPRLALLQLEMKVNATDRVLLENLNFCKSLGIPSIEVMKENKETLFICGSGPSLRKTWGLIPKGSDCMALNGAYKFLRKQGVVPTYFAMLDARPVNVNFLEELHDDTTYLLASQCHPDIYTALNSKVVGVFHLGTPTTRKVFPNEDLYVGGGGTIGLTSIAIALALGYRSVILLGFDSSFDGESRHVSFQPQGANEEAIDTWVKDRKYMTTCAMAAQTMDFFPFYDAIRKDFPNFSIHVIGDGLFYDFVTTNNNPSTRERELSKYADAYKEEGYGMSQERYDGLDVLIRDLPRGLESYLDVSTGRGETMELARKHGFSYVRGTETVDALCSEDITKAVLPNIPHKTKSFDVVSLIEVIEHLIPDDLEVALHELTRLARKHILISAAVRDCYIGGVNLHPSARSVEKWEELFRSVWGDRVYRVGNLGGSPAWRVDL